MCCQMTCTPSPGTVPLGIMRQVLEHCVLGADHDVMHHAHLGVNERWTVDRADHRHFDIRQVEQHLSAFPLDAGQHVGVGDVRVELHPGAKVVAGAGDDDAFVLEVGGDVGKGVAGIGMEHVAEQKRTAPGMQRHQQNAVLPLQTYVLVAILIILEFDVGIAESVGHDFLLCWLPFACSMSASG